MLVEFEDEQGKVIRQEILNYKDLYHMAGVIVTGKMVADESGNRSLKARGYFIESKTKLDVAKTEELKKKS